MRLFETFSSMNRSQEEGLREHNSPRKLFVCLLLLVFLLGGNAALAAYQALRLGRFDWSRSTPLLALVFLVVQLSRSVYRQLGG
jgi:hypothetical protein